MPYNAPNTSLTRTALYLQSGVGAGGLGGTVIAPRANPGAVDERLRREESRETREEFEPPAGAHFDPELSGDLPGEEALDPELPSSELRGHAREEEGGRRPGRDFELVRFRERRGPFAHGAGLPSRNSWLAFPGQTIG